MKPLISIVIPMRDTDPMPLLDSLHALQIPMQIIIVDDCSQGDAPDRALGWASRTGCAIELIRNQKRCYSYVSRLKGMAAATAPVVWNVDADDLIPKNAQPKLALAEWQKQRPDILHCRAVGVDPPSNLQQPLFWSEPIATELEGRAIFSAFMETSYPPAILWNKLFSLELCKKIVAHAPNIEVKYFDVKFIGLLFILFAQSYIGSNYLVYEYKKRAIRPAWLYSRQVEALLALERRLYPIVAKFAPAQAGLFAGYCRRRLVIQAGHLSIMAAHETRGFDQAALLNWLSTQLLANIGLTELIHALSISLAANARRIKEMIGYLCGSARPGQVEGSDSAIASPDESAYRSALFMDWEKPLPDTPEYALQMLASNALLATRLTKILAPDIDITKKAN